MTWVLIIVLATISPAIHTIEFNEKVDCELARTVILNELQKTYVFCVPKAPPKAPLS